MGRPSRTPRKKPVLLTIIYSEIAEEDAFPSAEGCRRKQSESRSAAVSRDFDRLYTALRSDRAERRKSAV